MAQRHSEYARRPREDYPSPPWLVRTLVPYLREHVNSVWDPCPGGGKLVRTLRAEGFTAFGNRRDFLKCKELPDPSIEAICTNPPFGRGGRLACEFIEHALMFDVQLVCMLLRIDFDSGRTRTHLFRDCPFFAQKLVLLNRIDWWPGPASSSTNHAWYIWDLKHKGPAVIGYVSRS